MPPDTTAECFGPPSADASASQLRSWPGIHEFTCYALPGATVATLWHTTKHSDVAPALPSLSFTAPLPLRLRLPFPSLPFTGLHCPALCFPLSPCPVPPVKGLSLCLRLLAFNCPPLRLPLWLCPLLPAISFYCLLVPPVSALSLAKATQSLP